MSAPKHTPGPWGYDGAYDVVMRDDVGAWIACVNFEHVDEEQAVADAHLIAAAPEMLEALKRLRAVATQSLDIDLIDGGLDALAEVDAAIAKAEGRP